MRFLKISLIALLVIVALLSAILFIAFTQRLSIVNNIAATQLTSFNAEVTCLDFHIAKDNSIIIDKLCLKSLKGNVQINKAAIQWQLTPTPWISSININNIDVAATDNMFIGSNQTTQTNNDTLATDSQFIVNKLNTFLDEISLLRLPKTVNIDSLTYVPPASNTIDKTHNSTDNNNQTKTPYSGSLTLLNNRLTFDLQDSNNQTFINTELIFTKNSFVLETVTQLEQLKTLLDRHNLSLSANYTQMLSKVDIAGSLKAMIEFTNSSLAIDNSFKNLSIASLDGINKSGPFSITGELDFTLTPLDNNKLLKLITNNTNTLTLNFSPTHFINLLDENNVPKDVVTLFKNNTVSQLSLTLPTGAIVNSTGQRLSLSKIELHAAHEDKTHTVTLNNLVYVPSLKSVANEVKFSIENFSFDSSLKLAELNSFTTAPVRVQLSGSIIKTNESTTLTLNAPSSITVNNILVSDHQNNIKTKKAAPLIAISSLTNHINGNITINGDKEPKLELYIDSNATQINIPTMVQLNSFTTNTKVTGELSNIEVASTAMADQVTLGELNLSGSIQSPFIRLSRNNLQLTDIFALKLKLPIDISLIDGLLTYDVSGKITDFNNLLNNQLNANVSISSLSGDIDGTWIQDLNWQQQLLLSSGKLTSLPNTKNNLTLALIDTPTPMTNLSVNIGGSFSENITINASRLKADVLGGSFAVPSLQWPIQKNHSVDVQLTAIDLEQVLALDKKQGIVVTGNISGMLPITFDGKRYTIGKGKLYNINNGLIQVIDNPAVIELKKSNTQLQLAFDALQNLHYHQLSSEVSMTDDGYMLLETVIKGRNPDIDNDVNLNLNLSYDLPGLLESLSITERFEKNILKGFKPH
ncbi:intermembrane phospholipid transport protein YdbH family protein [Thalassotalea piscium]|uniref:Dicarboxylate transport domain-containing protein n=1 Tax=Thalassotalea piscium TaxID=1230533 RepID=A0A7X0NH49_9GAMM|nr:YdbH domain-containing protein [Thalassotalea piscium]MBB6543263.1 hypothetical protein [Thalassotalea piscium]